MKIMKRLLLAALIIMALGLALPAAAQDGQAIEYGALVAGELDSANTSRFYSFTASAGDQLVIAMASEEFDTRIYVTDSSGDTLTEDDDGGYGVNSLIVDFVAPANGTYTIEASSFGGGSTGPFTVYVELVSKLPGLPLEEPLMGNANDLIGVYGISLQAEDVLLVELEVDDSFDPGLAIRPVSSESFDFGTESPYSGEDLARLGPYVPEGPGLYVIVAVGAGNYTLTRRNADVVTIPVGGSATATFSGQTSLFFSFDAEAGQVLGITVDSGNRLDTAMRVIGPFNYEVDYSDDGDSGVDPALPQFVVPDSGRYLIILEEAFFEDDLQGDVTVTIGEASLQSLDGGPLTLEFDGTNYMQLVAFEGVAERPVRLIFDMRARDPFVSPSITLEQDGEVVASAYSVAGVERLILEFTLENSGVVQIRIEAYSRVQIEVALERIPEPE